MEHGVTEQRDLAAGRFSTWLLQIGRAQQDGAEVPCGTCTACCTSSQFIHIGPDEAETLSQVPRDLRFPAPGLPEGHVVMGYDERGHCPMFVGGRCSIYEHRPRTCRTYDCRVLPAAGVDLDDDAGAAAKPRITERALRWRFDLPAALDEDLHAAVQAAAAFLREHAHQMPHGLVPRNPTQLAFLAIQVHDVFLDEGGPAGAVTTPSVEVVKAAVSRARSRSSLRSGGA